MLSRRALLGDGLLAPTLAYAPGTQGFPSRNLTVIVRSRRAHRPTDRAPRW
jgi:hypothetical protein